MGVVGDLGGPSSPARVKEAISGEIGVEGSSAKEKSGIIGRAVRGLDEDDIVEDTDEVGVCLDSVGNALSLNSIGCAKACGPVFAFFFPPDNGISTATVIGMLDP